MAGWASPLGRWALSLIWCVASALVLAAAFLGARSSGASPPTPGDHATYYMVAHNHYALSLAAVFAVFAIAYAVLGGVFDLMAHRWLGYVHLALMIAGVGIIFSPQYLIRSGLLHKAVDANPVELFMQLNRLSMAGYIITLAGLLVFVAALLGAAWKLWRRLAH